MASKIDVGKRLQLRYGTDGEDGTFTFSYTDPAATGEQYYALGQALNSLQDAEHVPAEFVVVTRSQIV